MGREAAVLFAREGARVVVCDINKSAADETVALVEKAGGQALAAVGDVAIEDDVKRMVESGVKRFGALHILYNNAGVLWKDKDRSVLETDGAQWDRVMAINLKSVFWGTKHGIPHLQRFHHPRRLGLGAGGLHPRAGRLHGREGSPHLAQQVAGHPVRQGPDPLQHHPPGDRRDPAAGAVSHARAQSRVQDGHTAGTHRPAP